MKNIFSSACKAVRQLLGLRNIASEIAYAAKKEQSLKDYLDENYPELKEISEEDRRKVIFLALYAGKLYDIVYEDNGPQNKEILFATFNQISLELCKDQPFTRFRGDILKISRELIDMVLYQKITHRAKTRAERDIDGPSLRT